MGFYNPQKDFIPKGESRSYFGRTFEGPAMVSSEWEPGEISGVIIGADRNAKKRALEIDDIKNTEKEKNIMSDNEVTARHRAKCGC